MAAKNGQTEAVKLLVDKRADIESKDNYGKTPLHCAIQNNRTEVVNFLKVAELPGEKEAREQIRKAAEICSARNAYKEGKELLKSNNSELQNKAHSKFKEAHKLNEQVEKYKEYIQLAKGIKDGNGHFDKREYSEALNYYKKTASFLGADFFVEKSQKVLDWLSNKLQKQTEKTTYTTTVKALLKEVINFIDEALKLNPSNINANNIKLNAEK